MKNGCLLLQPEREKGSYVSLNTHRLFGKDYLNFDNTHLLHLLMYGYCICFCLGTVLCVYV